VAGGSVRRHDRVQRRWVSPVIPEGSRLEGHLLLDVVYAGWPVRTFEEAVANALSGFEMLLHRASGQVHQVTGLLARVEQMRAAGRTAIESR
jgi:shikimate 5-dehydrogenase